ncbi:COQ9 family protein [Ferruginivarius sediminum]|nr:COQ9 family protein [Ferruginivarius sediminum]
MAEYEDIESLRRDLMQATLGHVAFDGWSWAAIHLAAEDLGLDRVDAENAFPGGPAEVLELFSTEADYAMLAAMEEHDLASMGVRERVVLAVRTRLEQNERHQEAIRRGLSFLAMPQHAGLASKLLYRTVDAVWVAAGDASSDYNFYTKRILLAGVYSSTLLYWLEDRSEEHEDTWDFLRRRVEDVVRVGGRLGRTVGRLGEVRRGVKGLRPRGPRGSFARRR